MAQISLFKELLNQIKCEAIPGIGFTQDDLDRVKACVDTVKPIEAINFDPTISSDQDQIDQAACIESATKEVRLIIASEQRKIPNAVRYSLLKAKIQELRDNAAIAKVYYDERYKFFTDVLDKTQSLTSEHLYWTEEYDRLKGSIQVQYSSIISGTLPVSIKTLALILRDASVLDESTDIRDAILKIKDDFTNLKTFANSLALPGQQLLFSAVPAQSLLLTVDFVNLVAAIKAKALAFNSREIARGNAIKAQADKIQSLEPLSPIDTFAQSLIQNSFSRISNQLVVKFSNTTNSKGGLTVPARTTGIMFRLISRNFVSAKITQFNESGPQTDSNGNAIQVDELIKIYNSPVLKSNLFRGSTGFKVFGVNAYDPDRPISILPIEDPNYPGFLTREDSDYSILSGKLYNGISGNSYLGLYKKLAKPINLLYTLEERGLTLNANEIDPIFKDIKDAPTSIKEDEITLYIKNQATYETFYDTLAESYPKRIKYERETVFTSQISTELTRLRLYARREAAETLRKVSDSALKLARPTTYTAPNSSVYAQGSFEYSVLDNVLSEDLAYYTKAQSEISKLVVDCDSELARLDSMISENSMDEKVIQSKILSIPCFKKSADAATKSGIGDIAPLIVGATANAALGQPDCEKKAREKLGKDPLYIRTLSGTDSSLPDLTSQCYWKEFAKALNKVTILPFPDISGPPPANLLFRYWPITCALPIPFALVLLPIPPRWKPIFVLPTPLGTLVCLLTMPIAPIGIPLPSIYLFFIGMDGNKYLALSTNLPLLYAPPTNIKFGFEQDNSAASLNPLGLNLTNSYKGQPMKGSLTMPLSVSAPTAKAIRLSSLAAQVATGTLSIANLAGDILPIIPTVPSILLNYLSESEMMLNIANAAPSNDFKRQIETFRSTMNRQLDKLGEMQTGAIVALKEKLSKAKESAMKSAETEKEPSKRRKNRKKARDINPTSLPDKINAAIKSFNDYIDNITFGTFKYPKDPSKFNPELPSAVTAILDIIEMASTGDLKLDASATSLNAQLLNVINKIDYSKLSDKTSFDLSQSKDLEDFKSALKKLSGQAIGFLKGDSFDSDVSSAKDKTEAQAIADSNKAVQDTIKKALALTALSLASPIKLTIFDLGKKCCEVQASNVFSGVPPELAIAFTIITALIETLIDGLDADTIIASLAIGSTVVGLNMAVQVLETMLETLPTVPIPDPAGLIALVSAIIIPILSIISIPKAPAPLHIPFLFPIVIPLDPILKPLLNLLWG